MTSTTTLERGFLLIFGNLIATTMKLHLLFPCTLVKTTLLFCISVACICSNTNLRKLKKFPFKTSRHKSGRRAYFITLASLVECALNWQSALELLGRKWKCPSLSSLLSRSHLLPRFSTLGVPTTDIIPRVLSARWDLCVHKSMAENKTDNEWRRSGLMWLRSVVLVLDRTLFLTENHWKLILEYSDYDLLIN